MEVIDSIDKLSSRRLLSVCSDDHQHPARALRTEPKHVEVFASVAFAMTASLSIADHGQ